MACSTTTDGGYHVEVIENYSPELNCGICTEIIRDATHGCKNHAFCNFCIISHVELGIRDEGNVVCPGGCREVINPTELQPNPYVDRMIKTLKTKCSYEGCAWQGDLLDLVQDHQINCKYLRVSCRNTGCNEFYLKQYLAQHDKVCMYKKVQCSYCCYGIIKINKDQHEFQCSVETVKCEYFDIGCKITFYRKDAHLHEINYKPQHTRLIIKTLNTKLSNSNGELLKSNNEIKRLKYENNELLSELTKLKILSDEKIDLLEEQVKKINKELLKVKNENFGLKKVIEKPSSYLKVDVVRPRLKVKPQFQTIKITFDILREKISKVPELAKVFSLSNNVVHIIDPLNKLDKYNCYKGKRFDYIIDQFDLYNHQILVNDVLHEVPFHLYRNDQYGPCYYFCFPFEFHNVKDFDISIPNKFNVKLLDNELVVNSTSLIHGYCELLHLKAGQYEKIFHEGSKLNLKKLEDAMIHSKVRFPNGYACLELFTKPE